jgi:hypothetical protein
MAGLGAAVYRRSRGRGKATACGAPRRKRSRISAFAQALTNLGWTDGRNADEPSLGGLQTDIIGTNSTAPGAVAVQRETRTVPIVFANLGDPVASGLVGQPPHVGAANAGSAERSCGIHSIFAFLCPPRGWAQASRLDSEIRRLGDRNAVIEEQEISFGANLLAELSLRAPVAPRALPGLIVGVGIVDSH